MWNNKELILAKTKLKVTNKETKRSKTSSIGSGAVTFAYSNGRFHD